MWPFLSAILKSEARRFGYAIGVGWGWTAGPVSDKTGLTAARAAEAGTAGRPIGAMAGGDRDDTAGYRVRRRGCHVARLVLPGGGGERTRSGRGHGARLLRGQRDVSGQFR